MLSWTSIFGEMIRHSPLTWSETTAYVDQCAKAITVLCELGGADQSGDLKGVLADGAVGQVLDALPSGRIALFLQLQLCGRQVQVQRQILQLLSFCLVSTI